MVKKFLIKLNIVRKWLRSFGTSPDLITTLFHKKYYRHFEFDQFEKGPENNTFWRGVKVIKPPSDLWIYQEIIWETKPDIIIECGTFEGGSTYFMASIFDLIGHGQVITVDNTDSPFRPKHPRITYIKGSTVEDKAVSEVKKLIKPGQKVMAILDSNHRKNYVLKEMAIYGPMVGKGCYMVVEDTHLNGHPIESNYGPGPMEAVKEFITNNSNFIIDKNREKFLFSFNHNGYLKKIS